MKNGEDQEQWMRSSHKTVYRLFFAPVYGIRKISFQDAFYTARAHWPRKVPLLSCELATAAKITVHRLEYTMSQVVLAEGSPLAGTENISPFTPSSTRPGYIVARHHVKPRQL